MPIQVLAVLAGVLGDEADSTGGALDATVQLLVHPFVFPVIISATLSKLVLPTSIAKCYTYTFSLSTQMSVKSGTSSTLSSLSVWKDNFVQINLCTEDICTFNIKSLDFVYSATVILASTADRTSLFEQDKERLAYISLDRAEELENIVARSRLTGLILYAGSAWLILVDDAKLQQLTEQVIDIYLRLSHGHHRPCICKVHLHKCLHSSEA